MGESRKWSRNGFVFSCAKRAEIGRQRRCSNGAASGAATALNAQVQFSLHAVRLVQSTMLCKTAQYV